MFRVPKHFASPKPQDLCVSIRAQAVHGVHELFRPKITAANQRCLDGSCVGLAVLTHFCRFDALGFRPREFL